MATYSLDFSLHEICCRFETNHRPLVKYFRDYLPDLVKIDLQTPRIRVQLYWGIEPPAGWSQWGVRQWGRRLIQQGSEIFQAEAFALPGLQLGISWIDDHLQVEAYYRATSLVGKLAQKISPARQRLFAGLAYYLVYFPLVYYLEQQKGWQLLHVAGVARPDGAVLLAGLPGSGKTTLALGLLADPQARLLADNLLLWDGEQVYAVPEPVHLSASSRQLIPASARRRLEETRRATTYDRMDYRLGEAERAWQDRPRALFFIGLADQWEWKLLQTQAALSQMLAFDQLAREVDAFTQFSAALEAIAPRPGRLLNRARAIESLFEKVPAYQLWLQKGEPLEQAVRWIDRILAAGGDQAQGESESDLPYHEKIIRKF